MPTDKEIMSFAPEVEITLTQARDGLPEEVYGLIADALDEAQAPVFSGEQSHNFVIIKIVGDQK